MDPRQAAEAAALLQAKLAIPIHYDTLEAPPLYTQVDQPAKAFVAAAGTRGIKARILDPGDELDLSQPRLHRPPSIVGADRSAGPERAGS